MRKPIRSFVLLIFWPVQSTLLMQQGFLSSAICLDKRSGPPGLSANMCEESSGQVWYTTNSGARGTGKKRESAGQPCPSQPHIFRPTAWQGTTLYEQAASYWQHSGNG